MACEALRMTTQRYGTGHPFSLSREIAFSSNSDFTPVWRKGKRDKETGFGSLPGVYLRLAAQAG